MSFLFLPGNSNLSDIFHEILLIFIEKEKPTRINTLKHCVQTKLVSRMPFPAKFLIQLVQKVCQKIEVTDNKYQIHNFTIISPKFLYQIVVEKFLCGTPSMEKIHFSLLVAQINS